jgi:hypothetical protein
MDAQSADIRELVSAIREQNRSIERLIELIERPAAEAAVQDTAPADENAAPADEDRRPRPIDWLTMPPETQATVMRQLALFVQALVHRYSLQLELRPCWWRHGDVVEELSALWQYRQASFGEGAGLRDPMSWQDTFDKSRRRVSGMLGSCRERHVDADFGSWLSDAEKAEFYRAMTALENGPRSYEW